MTWWSQILSTLLFVLGTAWAVFVAIRINSIKSQNLPENQVSRLKDFSEIAARAVEYTHEKSPGKMDIAVGIVLDYFQEYNLHPPSRKAIERAIDSEFLLLSRTGDMPKG